MICKSCRTSIDEHQISCSRCGYPQNGSPEEKAKFVDHLVSTADIFKAGLRAERLGTKTLFFIGIVALLMVPVTYFMPGYAYGKASSFVVGYLLVGIFFVGLGYFSRTNPLLCFCTGVVVLIADSVVILMFNPSHILQGLYFKLLMLGGLIFAIIKTIKAALLVKRVNTLR